MDIGGGLQRQQQLQQSSFVITSHDIVTSVINTLLVRGQRLTGAKMFLRLFITMLFVVILAWATVADVVADDDRVAGAFLIVFTATDQLTQREKQK